MSEFEEVAKKEFLKVHNKYLRSKVLYVALNIVSIFIVSLMIVLNLYAIKMNKLDDTKLLFVISSILIGFVGFITSISSFFSLRKNSIIYKTKKERIEKEYNDWKKGINKYKVKNKDLLLIEYVLKVNEE